MAPHTVSSSSSKKWSTRSWALHDRGHRPPLGTVRVGPPELGERHPQDPLDLRRSGRQDELRRVPGDDGTMWLRLTTVARWSSSPTTSTVAGIEADLLVSFSQRRLHLRFAGVEAAARKADLSGVAAQGC